MTRAGGAPAVDWHPYEPGGPPLIDKRGGHRRACARCGAPQNAYRHRSAEQMEAARAAMRAGALRREARKRGEPAPIAQEPRPLRPEPAAPPRPLAPRVADWRLSMLRLSLENALEGPELSFHLRRVLLDARGALRSELYGTVATLIGHTDIPEELPQPEPEPEPEPAQEPRTPTPTPLRSARVQRIARGFSGDKHRELYLRAVRAGWHWSLTGSGHVLLIAPGGEHVSLSMSVAEGRGHGWRNVRATAKRAGLDVAGL